nr:hypothetical protein [Oceanococcus sp. HetDA_MAG_MS8]
MDISSENMALILALFAATAAMLAAGVIWYALRPKQQPADPRLWNAAEDVLGQSIELWRALEADPRLSEKDLEHIHAQIQALASCHSPEQRITLAEAVLCTACKLVNGPCSLGTCSKRNTVFEVYERFALSLERAKSFIVRREFLLASQPTAHQHQGPLP